MVYVSIGVITAATLLLIVSLHEKNCLLAVSNTAVIAANIHILMLRKLK